jgi:hypothetical protein
MSRPAHHAVRQTFSSALDIAPKPLGAAEPASRRAVTVGEPIFLPLPTAAGGWACVACNAQTLTTSRCAPSKVLAANVLPRSLRWPRASSSAAMSRRHFSLDNVTERSLNRRSLATSSGHVEIIFFSTPTRAAMARWYSRGTVAESCRAIPVESKIVISSSDVRPAWPSHISSITPCAPRRGDKHVARGRRGRMKFRAPIPLRVVVSIT